MRLRLLGAVWSLALSAILVAPAAQASDSSQPAATYDSGTYISFSSFTADFAKRSVVLKYKIKKALPVSGSRIELVVRNVHASAPQLLKISDASLKVGSSYTLTYAVEASVPIDSIEASATLLTPLSNGILQRNSKLTTYASFVPSGTATGKLAITATHISRKLATIPVSSYVSVDAGLATAKQVQLTGMVATAYSSGLTADNLSDSASRACTLAAGNYVEATVTFAKSKKAPTGIDLVVGFTAWTTSTKSKKLCASATSTLNYLN